MGKRKTDVMRTYGSALLKGSLIGLGLVVVFFAGFVTRHLVQLPPAFASQDFTQEGYPLLDEVQNLLDAHYLRDQPDYIARQYAAIRGMLSTLGDTNTFFIEPPVAQSESDVLAGTYGGIGVSVQRNAEGLIEMYPFEIGPAAEAGIRPGDILLAVDGIDLSTISSTDQIDQLLRGEVGGNNGALLRVQRDQEEPYEVFVPFDVINVPSVQWRVLDNTNIGYIQILRFTSRTPDEMQEAIEALREQDIAAVVLDLRNNYGGLLQEAIEVASLFLDGGVVLYEVTRSGEETYFAEQGGALLDEPLVVLVNQGTASASELLAGAIRDRERGVLIGQRTFGKGTIQQIYTLSDNSSIHVTSAEWLTPARSPLDGVGLEPTIEMIPDEQGRDVEISEAVRYLEQLLVERAP